MGPNEPSRIPGLEGSLVSLILETYWSARGFCTSYSVVYQLWCQILMESTAFIVRLWFLANKLSCGVKDIRLEASLNDWPERIRHLILTGKILISYRKLRFTSVLLLIRYQTNDLRICWLFKDREGCIIVWICLNCDVALKNRFLVLHWAFWWIRLCTFFLWLSP